MLNYARKGTTIVWYFKYNIWHTLPIIHIDLATRRSCYCWPSDT